MSNSNHDIEAKLDVKPVLTAEERTRIWSGVSSRINTRGAIVSPYQFFFSYSKPLIAGFVAVVVLLGAGSTVAASDSARPGDLLFPVDRALEDVRLAFSRDYEKVSLKLRFTDERLREFESVTNQVLNDDLSGRTLTEAEADIFTNETIVKIEAGDRKAVFSTSAVTRADIVQAISEKYGFSEAEVDTVLRIETEDRASRNEDGARMKDVDRARIETALNSLTSFLLDINDSASSTDEVRKELKNIEERLRERSSSLPGEVRFRIRGNEGRIELRDDGRRIRVEMKDGELRIKDDSNDDDRHSEDRSDDDSNRRDSSSNDRSHSDNPTSNDSRDSGDDNDSSSSDDSSDDSNDDENSGSGKDDDRDSSGSGSSGSSGGDD